MTSRNLLERGIPIVCIVALSATVACQTGGAGSATGAPPPAPSADVANDPSGASTGSSAWVSLFDGITLKGWHNFDAPGREPRGWAALNGALTRVGPGGDLTTNRQYANFELSLEWRVAPGGNSGIIYRINPKSETSYTSGPEMQVLDDAGHADGKSRLTAAGSVYGLYAAPEGVVKPANEWNSVRLVVRGNHVEHWLNGKRVVSYELGSEHWKARMKGSKFAQWPGYGKAARGYIALQDHGDRVAYRNIRIREFR